MHAFVGADILLPVVDSMEKWAVIACDQFVSQPEYWQRVRQYVADAPSALHLILPEAELENGNACTDTINTSMQRYLDAGIFRKLENAFIYVERTLLNGSIRAGVIGAVDLEQYDYNAGSTSAIRATEKTVVERIPPRMNIRREAPIELPHVLLLCDDEKKVLIDSVAAQRDTLPKLYDFELMEGGGRIRGWLVDGAVADGFRQALAQYEQRCLEKYRCNAVLYAVGDGNHSLAAAKACYEELKANNPGKDLSCHPARYALVELENIHDAAQVFEPIHRIIKSTQPQALLEALQQQACAEDGCPVQWYAGDQSGTVLLNAKNGQLPIAVLQSFLDAYLKDHAGQTDYIHGDDALRQLSTVPGSIGFLLPAMAKGQFFEGIVADGVLPRKTFSMGHAQEKRYYLEARKIRE